MSNERKSQQIKKLLYIGIPIILIFIVLRFVIYYFKSDGFSGLSIMLPLFVVGIMIFALIMSGCFVAWVYKDCKKRGDDGVLWAIIILIVSPFIGLLLYFLKRPEVKQSCLSCGHRISLKANYCEKCGNYIENKEIIIMENRTHHLNYIVTGIICMMLMFTCLVGFIVSMVAGVNTNTSIASDKKLWNTGVISMSYGTYWDGIWKLNFKSASDGYVKEETMKISDTANEMLYADIHCDTIPDGATLTLWLVQGDVSKSIDVTNLSAPLEYSMNEFNNGKIRVRLQINGVENVKSEIYIK